MRSHRRNRASSRGLSPNCHRTAQARWNPSSPDGGCSPSSSADPVTSSIPRPRRLDRGSHAQHAFGPTPGRDSPRSRRRCPASSAALPADAKLNSGRRRARRVEIVVQRLGELPVQAVGRLDERRRVSGPAAARQPVLELAQPAGALARAGESLVGEIELLPIVGLEHQQPHGAGIDPVFAQIPRGGDVAEALRHLLAADVEELAVYPVPGEQLLARCTRSSGRSRPHDAGRSGRRRRRGYRARRCPHAAG